MKKLLFIVLSLLSVSVTAQRGFSEFPAETNPDSADIVITYDGVRNEKVSLRNLIFDESITRDKLNDNTAGDGLGRDVNGALYVKVDNTSMDTYNGYVIVANGGLDSSKYADGSIYPRHLDLDSLELQLSINVFTSEDKEDTVKVYFDETGNVYLQSKRALRFSSTGLDSLLIFDYNNNLVNIWGDFEMTGDAEINGDLRLPTGGGGQLRNITVSGNVTVGENIITGTYDTVRLGVTHPFAFYNTGTYGKIDYDNSNKITISASKVEVKEDTDLTGVLTILNEDPGEALIFDANGIDVTGGVLNIDTTIQMENNDDIKIGTAFTISSTGAIATIDMVAGGEGANILNLSIGDDNKIIINNTSVTIDDSTSITQNARFAENIYMQASKFLRFGTSAMALYTDGTYGYFAGATGAEYDLPFLDMNLNSIRFGSVAAKRIYTSGANNAIIISSTKNIVIQADTSFFSPIGASHKLCLGNVYISGADGKLTMSDTTFSAHDILNEYVKGVVDTNATMTANKLVYATNGHTIATDANLTRSAGGLTVTGSLSATNDLSTSDTLTVGAGDFILYETGGTEGNIDYMAPVMSALNLKFAGENRVSLSVDSTVITATQFRLGDNTGDNIYLINGGQGLIGQGTNYNYIDFTGRKYTWRGNTTAGLYQIAPDSVGIQADGINMTWNGAILKIPNNSQIKWGANIYMYGNATDTAIYIKTTHSSYDLQLRKDFVSDGFFCINRYPKATDYGSVYYAYFDNKNNGLGFAGAEKHPFLGVGGAEILKVYGDSIVCEKEVIFKDNIFASSGDTISKTINFGIDSVYADTYGFVSVGPELVNATILNITITVQYTGVGTNQVNCKLYKTAGGANTEITTSDEILGTNDYVSTTTGNLNNPAATLNDAFYVVISQSGGTKRPQNGLVRIDFITQ